ncbi:MAG TPA: 16S rRNA (adenine(1518)-N(6)/adenine(1519)-N(6))-dimethyltransferase RsmA, partial [bacterium]|nr:16S rRNA (adenine(1518)-N(6)/adenine(1519)-N(6))-dimethyltransferase RsmA [bacterium]
LASPEGIARLLRAHGIRLQRRLGQHLLVSRPVLDRLLDLAALSGREGVLEIGAGVGTLTAALAPLAARVTAIEFDRALLPALRDTTAPLANVTVIQGDALALDLAALAAGLPAPRRVVSNLPYNIAAPLILRLLERRLGFDRLVLTVQREVAERLAAPPASRSYGALSVAVQYRATVALAMRVPPAAFYPRPEVESAIVLLEVRERPPVAVADEAWFFRVVRAAFAQRRKTLRNAVAGALAVPPATVEAAARTAGIDPRRRGETLTLDDFARFADALAAANGGKAADIREERR